MQIKIITVPAIGGEAMNEELNHLLRSKKVLQVEQQLLTTEQGVFWCFCVKYVDENSPFNKKPKVDYKEVLDEASFKRFSELREIRRITAKEEDIPAYSVFSDEELAEMAKVENLTIAAMKKIKGIGDKKAEKYGPIFTARKPENEKSQ